MYKGTKTCMPACRNILKIQVQHTLKGGIYNLCTVYGVIVKQEKNKTCNIFCAVNINPHVEACMTKEVITLPAHICSCHQLQIPESSPPAPLEWWHNP